MTEPKDRPRVALLHVADRTGIVEFAHSLLELGFELVATGPTATALRQAQAKHVSLSEFTGERLPADALALLSRGAVVGENLPSTWWPSTLPLAQPRPIPPHPEKSCPMWIPQDRPCRARRRGTSRA